jgi:hypothetical protein
MKFYKTNCLVWATKISTRSHKFSVDIKIPPDTYFLILKEDLFDASGQTELTVLFLDGRVLYVLIDKLNQKYNDGKFPEWLFKECFL